MAKNNSASRSRIAHRGRNRTRRCGCRCPRRRSVGSTDNLRAFRRCWTLYGGGREIRLNYRSFRKRSSVIRFIDLLSADRAALIRTVRTNGTLVRWMDRGGIYRLDDRGFGLKNDDRCIVRFVILDNCKLCIASCERKCSCEEEHRYRIDCFHMQFLIRLHIQRTISVPHKIWSI